VVLISPPNYKVSEQIELVELLTAIRFLEFE